jgi:hypothetical protein
MRRSDMKSGLEIVDLIHHTNPNVRSRSVLDVILQTNPAATSLVEFSEAACVR